MTVELQEKSLLLIPVGLAIFFLLWSLWNWWREERRSGPFAGLTFPACGRLPVAQLGMGAWLAKHFAIDQGDAAEVHALAAAGTRDTLSLVARQLGVGYGDAHPLLAEELGISQFAVGLHLLPIHGLLLGKEPGGEFARVLTRNNPNGAAGGEIDKGGGHLAPVAKLKRALA